MALAAGTAGAIKAYLESKSLGIPIFHDAPPPVQPNAPAIVKPYITISEAIANTPDGDEDGGSAQGGTSYVVELAQVDLWDFWRETDGNGKKESRTLGPAIHRALAGALLDQSPTRVYGVTVRNHIRFEERDANIVHRAITLAIRRVV